jgi:hypothetical protein
LEWKPNFIPINTITYLMMILKVTLILGGIKKEMSRLSFSITPVSKQHYHLSGKKKQNNNISRQST